MQELSQEKLKAIFNGYNEIVEHSTGEVFYLNHDNFNILVKKGIIRFDEENNNQWGFDKEDIGEIEKVI